MLGVQRTVGNQYSLLFFLDSFDPKEPFDFQSIIFKGGIVNRVCRCFSIDEKGKLTED